MGAYVAICDGGSNKDGGYCSFLIVGLRKGKIPQVIEHKDRQPLGDITNNEAEYKALISALEYLKKSNGSGHNILIISDSQLMIRQLEGTYDAKSESLRVLRDEVLALLEGFHYELRWTPRNIVASTLAH